MKGKWAIIALPYLWLLALFLIPFVIVFKMSLSDPDVSIPPYTPQLDLSQGWDGLRAFWGALDFENYSFVGAEWIVPVFALIALAALTWRAVARRTAARGGFQSHIFGALAAAAMAGGLFLLAWLTMDVLTGWLGNPDPLYWKSYLSSVRIALISTALTLAVGFPIAYAMALAPQRWRPLLVMLIILPFWTSFLIRVYAWKVIFSAAEASLDWIQILNTQTAVYIGIVYTYLPFMVLPIYAALERLDHSLTEAAQDLGCTRFSAFWLIVMPLSRPGVIAGCFLVFIPAVGEYVIPQLLGGSSTLMIGQTLVNEYENNRDWPLASAVAVILLLILIIPIILFQRHEQRQREAEST